MIRSLKSTVLMPSFTKKNDLFLLNSVLKPNSDRFVCCSQVATGIEMDVVED